MTNRDKLRSLDDEKLSQEIAVLIVDAMCVPQIYHGRATTIQIAESLCRWFKEENSEEEDNGNSKKRT